MRWPVANQVLMGLTISRQAENDESRRCGEAGLTMLWDGGGLGGGAGAKGQAGFRAVEVVDAEVGGAVDDAEGGSSERRGR